MHAHQKSLNFGQYTPNDKVLNKKIPENPRYRNVMPAVDSGKNVKRHIHELKEKQKSLSHKKDEIFYRVKLSTFIKLAVNVAKDNLKQEEITDHDTGDCIRNSGSEVKKEENKRMANVLMGIGEIDLRNEKKKPPTIIHRIEKKVPYLLLDVRDRESFLQSHIKTAKHYPSALLSRSIGYEIEEMKQYKNNRPELIIVYDDDESIASRVATTLVQRGYENIYLLSGGLKLGYDIFPRGLMNVICSVQHAASKLGACGMVQIKTPSSEFFTQEDIDSIQQYIEEYPGKGYNPLNSSKSYSSCSKGYNNCYQKSGDSPEFSSKHGSLTYRKDSACSSKSVDRVRMRSISRSATDGRLISKKAPWK